MKVASLLSDAFPLRYPALTHAVPGAAWIFHMESRLFDRSCCAIPVRHNLSLIQVQSFHMQTKIWKDKAHGMSLRARCAISGTDIACGTGLRACHAMSGTDTA
eukprot:1887965-Rhodomonas_salina.3